MTTMRPSRPDGPGGGEAPRRDDPVTRCLRGAASVLTRRDQSRETALRRVAALIFGAFDAPDATSVTISLGAVRVIAPSRGETSPSGAGPSDADSVVASVFNCGSGRTGTVEVRLRPPAGHGAEGDSGESSGLTFSTGQRLLVDALAMLIEVYCMDHDRQVRIEQERDRFLALFRKAPVPSSLSDLEDGIFVDVNDRWCELTGFAREDVIGKTALEIGLWDSPEVRASLRRQVESERVVDHFRVGFRRKDGERRTGFGSAQRIELADRAFLHATVHDVTDEVRVEEERARMAERRGALERLTTFGELAGGIAHDMNNLLLPILINVELALSGAPEALRAPLSEIREAARRAGDLTRKLLTFAGKQPLRRSDVDLAALVREETPALRRAVPETVHVRVTAEQGLPPAHADPAQIEHVLANLVLNARDAVGADGRIHVSVHAGSERAAPEIERDAGSGPYVYLTVEDDGHGIPEGAGDKLFEPFYTTKDEATHTGLGLSSVLGIVERHAGRITVGRSAGGGARFSVGLPIRDRTGDEEDGGARAAGGGVHDGDDFGGSSADGIGGGAPGLEARSGGAPAGGGVADAPNPEPILGRGRTVLVVEDDAAVRRVTTRVLRAYGYDVLEAEGGRAALLALESRADEVDLIISDMVMPGMSGLELRDALEERGIDLPTLFVSGYSWSALAARGIDAEDVRILPKPFTPSQLGEAVARAFAESSP